MSTVMTSATLFLTIFLCFAFGIFAGYAAFKVVLRAFALSSRRSRPAPVTTLASASSAPSGD